MEEAAELVNYLPLSFKSPKEQEYIEFLWDAFETNYIHGNYLSRRDIDICLAFDAATLHDHEGVAAIRELHATLVKDYKTDESKTPA